MKSENNMNNTLLFKDYFINLQRKRNYLEERKWKRRKLHRRPLSGWKQRKSVNKIGSKKWNVVGQSNSNPQLLLYETNQSWPHQCYCPLQGETDGKQFSFVTRHGLHYEIRFFEEQPIGGCETWQFSFAKAEDTPAAEDPYVRFTLFAVIDEFFTENDNVMLYICDTSDSREAARNRLFIRWFKQSAEPGRFTIRTANATIEGQGFYAAIIVENRNPLLTDITADFDQTAVALTNKPSE